MSGHPSSGSPTVSILIRIRNEASALSRVLQLLATQELHAERETVVLDNTSDDDSADVALAAGARVFRLPRHLFGYGRAINVGVELCRGEFVVLLSAHAWPQGERWLQTMVDALREDPNLAGAYCRQAQAEPLSRQEDRRFRAFGRHGYVLGPDDLFDRTRRGADVYEICRFSNSACILRREAAAALTYRDLPYAEDRGFVLDALLDGHRIAYVPDAVVTYQRPYSFRSLYHVGRRAQIAKHLIREIATAGLGRDMRRNDTPRLLGLLLLKPAGTAWRILASPLVDRGASARARRYALASWGSTLGMLVGDLTWRSHRSAAGCDASLLQAAREQVQPHRTRATAPPPG
ncbi:MAG: glycosyltransferase family 2 protein [Pseudonocardiaceae bacterium]